MPRQPRSGRRVERPHDPRRAGQRPPIGAGDRRPTGPAAGEGEHPAQDQQHASRSRRARPSRSRSRPPAPRNAAPSRRQLRRDRRIGQTSIMRSVDSEGGCGQPHARPDCAPVPGCRRLPKSGFLLITASGRRVARWRDRHGRGSTHERESLRAKPTAGHRRGVGGRLRRRVDSSTSWSSSSSTWSSARSSSAAGSTSTAGRSGRSRAAASAASAADTAQRRTTELHAANGHDAHRGRQAASPRCALAFRQAVKAGYAPNPESVGSEMSGFSSSSTFTSLNVITRTFFTNRAGRYMSQTHASCISTSK